MKDGEVICNKCNGEGSFWSGRLQESAWTCEKCNGKGAVDWITNIMWERHSYTSMFEMDADGSVDLYYAGNKIIETTADGGIKLHGRQYKPC